eukprot:TCONS_00009130-protein
MSNLSTLPIKSCLNINNMLDVTEHQRYLLGMFYIFIGLIGALLNILPCYIVCRTKQLKNPSSRLAYYLSISDMLRSTLGYLLFGLEIMIKFKWRLKCWQRQLLTSPLILFSMSSAYLHCVIILDRFFRIIFIQNYSTFLTKTKFALMMLTYFLIVGVQFSLTVIGDEYMSQKLGGMLLTLPLNVILFVTSLCLHLKSIKALHIHQQTVCLTLNSQNVLKLATIYLVIFIIFYLPILTANLLVLFQTYLSMSDKLLSAYIITTLAVSAFSSPVNAIAFTVKNIQARKTIRKQYDRIRKSTFPRPSNKVASGPSAQPDAVY